MRWPGSERGGSSRILATWPAPDPHQAAARAAQLPGSEAGRSPWPGAAATGPGSHQSAAAGPRRAPAAAAPLRPGRAGSSRPGRAAAHQGAAAPRDQSAGSPRILATGPRRILTRQPPGQPSCPAAKPVAHPGPERQPPAQDLTRAPQRAQLGPCCSCSPPARPRRILTPRTRSSAPGRTV